MSVAARQLGHPRGLLGRLVGHALARNNADFNRFLQVLNANNSTTATPGLKAETPWWQSAASLLGSFL